MPVTTPAGPLLNVAARIPHTLAEGPGARYAVWVQGCPLRCAGCCNPHMLPFIPAHPALPAALAADIAAQPGIEGVTVMGGEPFAQAEAVADLLRRVRAAGLSTMVFSGYTLAELRAGEPAWAALLAATDLLVDGRYDAAQRVTDRRWIGSANQQVHFLTERYGFLADRWPRRNTVELRLRGGEVTLNGFPIAGATRIGRKRGGEA